MVQGSHLNCCQSRTIKWTCIFNLESFPETPASIILYEMDANQEINPEDYTDYSNSENCIDPEDYHDDCPSINEEQNGSRRLTTPTITLRRRTTPTTTPRRTTPLE